jgi:carbon-monoxide dehydrogenase medium subunit
MKPPPFKYFAPDTVEEALAHLAEYGYEAKALAGGQSLIPTMNFRLAQPGVLVDLNNIPELAYIRPGSEGGVAVGAMTRQRQVERSDLIADRVPLVHETMPYIAHPQIRNRGTFGGSIAHADPASELPALALALDALFKVRNQSSERWVRASEFFIDLFATALEPDDLLIEVSLPEMAPQTGYAFEEVSRRHGDYALVGLAATITVNLSGQCQRARLVFFSVGTGPVEAFQAQADLDGEDLSQAAIQAAADIAASTDLDPPSDIHASTAYRRHLARVLAQRVLTRAAARAAGNGA